MAANMPLDRRNSVTLAHSSTLPMYSPASSITEVMFRANRNSPMVISALCGAGSGVASSRRWWAGFLWKPSMQAPMRLLVSIVGQVWRNSSVFEDRRLRVDWLT